MIKQNLGLRLGQHLNLTPQLQQAIQLLQLSNLELASEIQKAVQENPLLEIQEESVEKASEEEWQLHVENKRWEEEIHLDQATVPTELPVDSVWEDVYPSLTFNAVPTTARDYEYEVEIHYSPQETLEQHLLNQLVMGNFSTHELLIAYTLIDSIDEQGFLRASIEDIVESMPSDYPTTSEQINAVLNHIQQFSPAGVGARNLQECLLIQLRQLPPTTPWQACALLLVEQHMEQLVQRDYKALMHRYELSEVHLQEVLACIKALNPRPGRQLFNIEPSYIIPDVVVRKQQNKWVAEVNETTPRLGINHRYAALAQQATTGTDQIFLRNHLQEARWFLKSLRSRQDTLLKVANCIIEEQYAFLERGEEAMRPLVLQDIAQKVGMHESTISRITTQKYMHTPRGVFELKYFFSSRLSTHNGGECSATAIRALIKKAIAVENPRKPLSDDKLTRLLNNQGICVARRTVAKYREALAIPTAKLRKLLF